MSEKICRLCLQTTSRNYQIIEEQLKNTLKLKYGYMDISKEAVACFECTNNLEVFFKFRSDSGCKREQSLETDLKDDIGLDPEKIEITNYLISVTENKNEEKCWFCTKTSEREFLTSLNESKEHTFLVDLLKEHIPKLNLNITEELLTCETCLNELQGILSFIMKYLDVEQKISKYTQIKGTDEEGQIDLKDVQQFIFEPIVKFEVEPRDINELKEKCDQFQEGCVMQPEAGIKCEEEVDNSELFIKTEDIDLKSEHSDCDSLQQSPTIIKLDKGCLDISVPKAQGSGNQSVTQCDLTYITSDGMFKCELCPYEGKSMAYLKRHKVFHSSSDITVYNCDLCSYQAKRSKDITRHKLIHKSTAELRTFKCDLCSYETKYRNYLEIHKLVHKSSSDLTMFKCDLCPYEAKRKEYLKQHILVHKNTLEITMFKCELCPYEAKRRSQLTQHVLAHKRTAESTMFKCDLCPYETNHKNYLKRHTLVHKSSSNLTMFKCDVCPYQAKRSKNLTRHKLTHKNVLQF